MHSRRAHRGNSKKSYKTHKCLTRILLVFTWYWWSLMHMELSLPDLGPRWGIILYMGWIECKWEKSFILPRIRIPIRLMWSTASELGLMLLFCYANLNWGPRKGIQYTAGIFIYTHIIISGALKKKKIDNLGMFFSVWLKCFISKLQL